MNKINNIVNNYSSNNIDLFFLKTIYHNCRSPPNQFKQKFELIGGKNMDKRPKRRKADDNPYILSCYTEKGKYFVSFKDINKKYHNIEISYELFNVFDQIELEDISQMHYFERHIEHSELTEATLYKRTNFVQLDSYDVFLKKIEKKNLYSLIKQLPKKQRERIIQIYFEGKTTKEIAENEGVSMRVVQQSVKSGLEKLKKFKK